MIRRESNAQMLRRLRATAVANGLCTVCRCRSPRTGLRNCDDCLARVREYKKGAGRPADQRRKRAKGRRRRARWKAEGLCVLCGRAPALAGFASCSGCLDKTRARVAAIYRAKRAA